MPIHWSQVRSGLDPLKYTIRTAPGLLSKSKPWEDYDDGARSLVSAIQKITNTDQVSLDESVAAEKPKRRVTRKSVRGARKAARKTITSHRGRPSTSARIAGRP